MKMSWTKYTLSLLAIVASSRSLAQDLITKSPRRAPSSQLKLKQSGVPAFDLVSKKGPKGLARVESIPRLDIGEEPTLEASQVPPLPLPPARNLDLSFVKKLNLPKVEIDKNLTRPSQVQNPKSIAKLNSQFQTPKLPELKEIADPSYKEANPNPVEVKSLSAADLKLVDALIFLELHQNYGLAFGLLSEIIKEAPERRTEASYQLGLTSLKLNLYSEFRHQLLRVLKDKSTDWQKRAATALAMGAKEGDEELVALVDGKIEEHRLDLKGDDQYQLNRAQFYLGKNNLSLALHATESVDEDSRLYGDAQFLRAILLYRAGEVKKALEVQEQAFKKLESAKNNSQVRSFAALTLARMYFQQGRYKEAFQAYLKVDKNHPDWPNAMVEQAWAQILTGDYEGAAGNMFTLHTDFFKHRFSPDSYVVRTIGYLNLCQFGDGVKVLYDFKRKFTPMVPKLDEYKKKTKTDLAYYETVRTLFAKPEDRIVHGLPRSFVVELARHPNFINEQRMINSLEDQAGKFNNLTVELIETERLIIKRQSDLQTQIIELRKRKKPEEAKAEVALLEQKIEGLKIQQAIAKRARNSIKDLRSQALARMEKEKDQFKVKGGVALKNRFQQMYSTLIKTLDQSELLAYEIYSGAGEHLRYQLAGGETKEKSGLELKVSDGKSVKWEFKGEIWEDELGYYRSSLKNVCASQERLSTTER